MHTPLHETATAELFGARRGGRERLRMLRTDDRRAVSAWLPPLIHGSSTSWVARDPHQRFPSDRSA